MRVEFDKAPLEETQGAFLAVLFGSLVKKALTLGVLLRGLAWRCRISEPQPAVDGGVCANCCLCHLHLSPKLCRCVRRHGVFDNNTQQAQRACVELIARIEQAAGAKLPIIAEGVDKFPISSAGYVALAEVLDWLSEHKTLYEANAVHLFDAGCKWVASEKLFIGPLADEAILGMYEKRLVNLRLSLPA